MVVDLWVIIAMGIIHKARTKQNKMSYGYLFLVNKDNHEAKTKSFANTMQIIKNLSWLCF